MKTLTLDKKEIRDYFFEIKEFCDKIEDDKNYSSKYWMHNKHSLLNKLFLQKDMELTTLIYDWDKLVCVSGIEKSDFDDKVAVAAKRTYISKSHRGKGIFSKYLLPEQIEWAEKNGYLTVIIAINKPDVLRLVERIMKKSLLGLKAPDALYQFKEYSKKLIIKDTEQTVFYLNINGRKRWNVPKNIKVV